MYKTWVDTWYIMADGDPVGYEALKCMDVREFYFLWDSWRTKLQAIENANKKK